MTIPVRASHRHDKGLEEELQENVLLPCAKGLANAYFRSVRHRDIMMFMTTIATTSEIDDIPISDRRRMRVNALITSKCIGRQNVEIIGLSNGTMSLRCAGSSGSGPSPPAHAATEMVSREHDALRFAELVA